MTDNKALVLAYIEKEHPGIFKILQTPAGLHTPAEKVKLNLFKSVHSKEDLAKKAKKYFDEKLTKAVEAADKAAASKTPLGAALDAAIASRKASRFSFMPMKRSSVFPDFSALVPPGTSPFGGARKKRKTSRTKLTSKTRRKKRSTKKKSPLRKRRKVTKVSKKRSPKRKTKKVIRQWSW